MNITQINHPLCDLAECPIWHSERERFYWSDILGRTIWELDPVSAVTKKIWDGDLQPSGMALCEEGNLLICSDRGLHTLNPETRAMQDLFSMELEPGERFNDCIVDPAGRIFAGTLKADCKNGNLYRLEAGKDPVVVLSELGITNGMGFSANNRLFYHTDSVTKRIIRYNYDLETGALSGAEKWFEMDASDGCPDGMTVDIEDHIWTACWGGGQLLRISPDGKITERISLPALQPSSLAFGGADMKTVLVTTAAKSSKPDPQGRFIGGRTYLFESPVSGKPEYRATF